MFPSENLLEMGYAVIDLKMCLWKILHELCGFVTKNLLGMLWFCGRIYMRSRPLVENGITQNI